MIKPTLCTALVAKALVHAPARLLDLFARWWTDRRPPEADGHVSDGHMHVVPRDGRRR